MNLIFKNEESIEDYIITEIFYSVTGEKSDIIGLLKFLDIQGIISEEELSYYLYILKKLPEYAIFNNSLLDKNKSIQERFLFIKENIFDSISNFLQKLEYSIFLRTVYWNTISLYKKEILEYRCQLCNSSINLNTHHSNYKNKGFEHNNLNDLIVICNSCHKKHHNK